MRAPHDAMLAGVRTYLVWRITWRGADLGPEAVALRDRLPFTDTFVDPDAPTPTAPAAD